MLPPSLQPVLYRHSIPRQRWLPPLVLLMLGALTLAHSDASRAVEYDPTSIDHTIPGRPSSPNLSIQIVDDLGGWKDIPYNCGFAPSPLPSGTGFFKGGLTQNWVDGGVPADGVRNVWDGHAYWTGARSIWIDHDTNNWAIWAPSCSAR